MASNLRYTAAFQNHSGKYIQVSIYKEGYEGESEEMLLSGDNPVIITYEQSDDVFKPVKYSGASIKVLTPNVLSELYTGKVTDVEISISSGETLSNMSIIWRGFNSPNLYNQEYFSDLDKMTIEAIDTLSALQYIAYPYADTNSTLTFYGIIKKCLKTIISYGNIEYYGILNNGSTSLLDSLGVNERCFLDSDGNPLKCNQVLEEICKIIGCTMFEYGNNNYHVESVEAASATTYSYRRYLILNDTYTERSGLRATKSLQVAENNCTLSYDDVYNKVKARCEISEVEQPQIEFKDLDVDAEIVSGLTKTSTMLDKTDKDGFMVRYQDIVPKGWWYRNKNVPSDNIYISSNSGSYGGKFIREAVLTPKYITSGANNTYTYVYDNKPELKWDTYFTYWIFNSEENESEPWTSVTQLDKHDILTKTIDTPTSYIKDSFFLLKFNFRPTVWLGKQSKFANNLSVTSQNVCTYNMHKPKVNNKVRNNVAFFSFAAKLKVGNKYFNGSTWQTTECYFPFYSEKKQVVTNAYSGDYSKSQDWGTDWNIYNTNDFLINTTSNDSGWLIPITEDLFGSLEFTLTDVIMRPPYNSEMGSTTDDEGQYNFICVNELSLEYAPYTNKSIFDTPTSTDTEDEEELTYEKVIDTANVAEYNELSFLVNTYNPDKYSKLSYSYIFINNNKFLSTLPKKNVEKRPEEHVLDAYSNYYGQPRMVYHNIVKYNGQILPVDKVRITPLNKPMGVGNLIMNLKNDNYEVDLYEY